MRGVMREAIGGAMGGTIGGTIEGAMGGTIYNKTSFLVQIKFITEDSK